MPRFKAKRAMRKVDPLVEHGKCVHVLYSNTAAFKTVDVTKTYGPNSEFTYTFSRERVPSKELTEWMINNCGPRGILWTTEKSGEGINIYFAFANQAMMFKLTWGGR